MASTPGVHVESRGITTCPLDLQVRMCQLASLPFLLTCKGFAWLPWFE